MITINLLPEKQRELLAKERLFRSVRNQVLIFITLPLVFVGIIAVLISFRNTELKRLDEIAVQNQQIDIYRELAGYENDFKQANNSVSVIDKVLKNNLYWSTVLNAMSGVIPEGIMLKHFSSTDYQVQITGIAASRQNLIDFQEQLSNNQCFSNINAPLSNLVSRENIEFVFEAEVNPDCLKQKS